MLVMIKINTCHKQLGTRLDRPYFCNFFQLKLKSVEFITIKSRSFKHYLDKFKPFQRQRDLHLVVFLSHIKYNADVKVILTVTSTVQ